MVEPIQPAREHTSNLVGMSTEDREHQIGKLNHECPNPVKSFSSHRGF